ncbi:extracelullar DNA degradation protein, EddB [Pseudoalteromonas luteoviolacea]|uniref:Extracelullar DNA degradation protein, EddB n=1 Tax=Pseudoalteromonas luteoviolacea TaxID=43657 RepID=A0A0C1MGA4_9GAMM|nr:ExeM/NucH family extracellular endonuclease [Pseudoalteromonas luteoviolacea]KID55894.1 extracelullar DNA degradation protein, EddB [Pseudoalteromonas luteoviolacea]
MFKKSLVASAITCFLLPVHAEVMISEYVEGSSYNKAVEIYNNSNSPINLSDYRLQFYFNGNTNSGTSIVLEGTVAPKDTHVIVHARAAEELRLKAQQQKDGSWFNGDDAVVLTKNDVIVDSIGQIGVDPGSSWSDQGVSTKDRTLVRFASVSSGDAVATDEFIPSVEWEALAKDDFSNIGIHNSSDPVEPPAITCNENNTKIHAIQGESNESPLVGEQVELQGVVTAAFVGDDQLKGFFVQEESFDQDDNALTSEGIFVSYQDNSIVEGQVVKLAGSVRESYGQTQISSVTGLVLCGTEAVVSTDITIPSQLGLEAYEGMLVNITNELFVNDSYGLKRYGELKLGSERLYQGTQVATPGDSANEVERLNRTKEITLDDGSSLQNPEVIPYPTVELDAYNTLRLGDKVTGVEGVVGYGFSQYRVHPVNQPNFVSENTRTDAPTELQGNLRVASMNVLNFFNGDGLGGGFPTARGADSIEEFERQKAKLVTAILNLDADVIGLLEVENDGFGEFSAIAELANALTMADANNTYQYVDMGTDAIGTDAIMSGIIYRSNKVKEAGTAAYTDAVPFDYGNRPPVMQTFEDLQTTDVFNVVVTHLRSKGSCSKAEGLDQDQLDGQGCWNQTRVTAVDELNRWLASNPTSILDDDTIILGDFNAYNKEDPIAQMTVNGYDNLRDVINSDSTSYSYVFKGRLGSLDHAFASSAMTQKVRAVSDWHINADEPVALDYNVEYKSHKHQQSLYADHAYRSSDHDPIVIDLQTQDPYPVIEGQIDNIYGWFWWQRTSIEVPEGYNNLEVKIEGHGEADLYLRHKRKPRFHKFDCRPYLWGSNEQCVVDDVQQGIWHVGLRGFLPYRNVTLSYKISRN